MSGGFSLIELVFVIAVVGILAAVALPKLVATRTDVLYAAVNSDIQAVISSVQVATLTQDLSANSLDGAFIMQAGGLSPTRWVAQGSGVRLGKNGARYGKQLRDNRISAEKPASESPLSKAPSSAKSLVKPTPRL